MASKLTDFSKFNVTVKSDTDIPSIDVVFFVSFLFICFVLFIFFLFFISWFLFSFFFFLLSFLSFFVSIKLRTVTVYTYNQGTAFSGL